MQILNKKYISQILKYKIQCTKLYTRADDYLTINELWKNKKTIVLKGF